MESPSKYRPSDEEIDKMVDESLANKPFYNYPVPTHGNTIPPKDHRGSWWGTTAARWPGRELGIGDNQSAITFATPIESADAEPPIVV